jgi:CDP-diacylglycerol--glycerol-3-phosphate 3-phosphatidyltransferase
MANYITLLRTLLAFVVVAMLHVRTKWMYVAAFLVTILLIWMDALDGYVARRRKETSKLGAVVDILGDRRRRDVLLDRLREVRLGAALGRDPRLGSRHSRRRHRALALERGMTGVRTTSMMRSKLGALLVSSRLSRALYGGREDARVLTADPGVRARAVPTPRAHRDVARLRQRLHDGRHVRDSRAPVGREARRLVQR